MTTLTSSDRRHRHDDTHSSAAAVALSPTDQIVDDNQDGPVGGGSDLHPTTTASAPTCIPSGASSPQPDPIRPTHPIAQPRQVADALLLLHADTLDDIEKMRVALENRLRSLTQHGKSESGHEWGKGVPAILPEIQAMTDHLVKVNALEHGATLMLQRSMRAHYLGGWVAQATGVGEKQAARLIATIGDPAARENPSQLWAFCGLHVVPAQRPNDTQSPAGGDDNPISHTDHAQSDTHGTVVGVAPTRRKGQRSNWSSDAKMRVYLVAKACIKAGVRVIYPDIPDPKGDYLVDNRKAITEYGQVYLDGRAKYTATIHRSLCVRCGPSGTPAETGSELSAGHKDARATRLVMKRILLDLWKAAGDEA